MGERGAIGKARGLEALNELDTATSFCSGGCERDATGKDCGDERLVLGSMTMRPASIRGRDTSAIAAAWLPVGTLGAF